MQRPASSVALGLYPPVLCDQAIRVVEAFRGPMGRAEMAVSLQSRHVLDGSCYYPDSGKKLLICPMFRPSQFPKSSSWYIT